MVSSDPFYTPEPTHYKFRISIQLDIGSTPKEVMRETKLALSDEFEKDTDKVHVWEITYRYGDRESEILVSVRSLVTRDSLDDLEARTEQAMAKQFNQSPETITAPCIDTLP